MQSNGKGLPEWLSFNKETLVLQGTPPESTVFRKLHLVITGSDKY